MKLKRLSALALAGVITAGLALTGCGSMDPEATVATVNDIPISLGLANFAAQFTAVERGCDIDKPRNLAKSVTVE